MTDEFTKAALYGINTFNKKVKEKIGMQPFEGKSIEEIGIMVFGKSCKLNEEEKEKILEMFEIDQDITERQIIMEDNVNRARYFAEQLIRMKNIFNMMSIINIIR